MTRRDASHLMVLGGCALAWPHVSGCFTVGSEQQQSPRRELVTVLERVRRQHGLPGLAAAVVSGTRAIASGITGIRAGAARPRSTAGAATTSAAARIDDGDAGTIAVQREQLRWTTTLAEGLPSLAPRMRSEYASVTLEQLLAHEGKVPAYTQPSARRVEEMRALAGTRTEQRLAFLAEVLAEAPTNAAGDDAYSNAGYAAVGSMLEVATASTWEDLIQRELAQPLGLTTAGFGYPATVTVPNQPRGHAGSGPTTVELPLDETRQLPVCLWPAGAVHCSIGDLARYAADHLNGLRGREALLPAGYYERQHRRRGDSVFTLGWGIGRDQRWGVTHFGAGSGGWFFVRIVILPEHDAAVVIASNSGEAGDATGNSGRL